MSLLRRISLSLRERGSDESRLPRGTSFNDLSLGAAHWDAEEHNVSERSAGPGAPLSSVSMPSSPAVAPHTSPFGSAPAGNGFLKSPALSIPRTSVAHLLEQRLKSAESGTPRSSLDMPSPSVSTPRTSASLSVASITSAGVPSSPRAGPAAADMSEPASPRSPRTPGGRRRKSGKIDGMDYYEFCELIRSSSL